MLFIAASDAVISSSSHCSQHANSRTPNSFVPMLRYRPAIRPLRPVGRPNSSCLPAEATAPLVCAALPTVFTLSGQARAGRAAATPARSSRSDCTTHRSSTGSVPAAHSDRPMTSRSPVRTPKCCVHPLRLLCPGRKPSAKLGESTSILLDAAGVRLLPKLWPKADCPQVLLL